MARLKNKVAIVTGGASGIGKGTVRLFASEGAKVIIADRSREPGEALEKELVACGHDVLFCDIDVTDADLWQGLIATAVERFGALHLASDESKFVTGTQLAIDGGYTAQ